MIEIIFNKLYYNFKIDDVANILLSNFSFFLSIEDYYRLRLIKREKVDDIIFFVIIIIKIRYNLKYLRVNFKKRD